MMSEPQYSEFKPTRELPDRADLKPAINELLWRYGDPLLTLDEADRRAVRIFEIISESPQDSASGSAGESR